MTGESPDSVAIVGGGHAGATLAALLRQAGYAGRITLFGDEPVPPYHRPPLSKKYDEPAQWLRPAQFYTEQDIELRLGARVSRIDRAARTLELADGQRHPYGTLVLATGAAPRPLPVPGADARGVLLLRSLADAQALRDTLAATTTLVVVGGGYIGMEVAAVARTGGREVAVLEREERILARVASPELSRLLTVHHTGHGVRIHTGASVREVRADATGAVESVILGDGSAIECQAVLVGIGAVPNDALAREAGLTCADGIVVDRCARTSDPRVLAIGDVTRRPLDGVGERLRLESIPSAVEQAAQAAAVITGSAVAPHEVPWFWSDQYGLAVKTAGLPGPSARIVSRPTARPGGFALFHLRPDHTVCAVETLDAPKEFMAGRKLIATGRRVDTDRLADPAVPLRDIFRDGVGAASAL